MENRTSPDGIIVKLSLRFTELYFGLLMDPWKSIFSRFASPLLSIRSTGCGGESSIRLSCTYDPTTTIPGSTNCMLPEW